MSETERKVEIPPVDDLRIEALERIPSPRELRDALPNEASPLVANTRAAIHDILSGHDDRLVVVVGPCSVHDPEAALDYAGRLREQAARLSNDLLVIMRVYFEKPRTSIGWKGLFNDPHLNGSNDIAKGLHVGRGLLRRINQLGLPAGTEFLDTVMPQYISDQISWGAIGARTTESQIHRQLASALSCPIGFKNGTNGNVNVAVAAILAARHSHRFLAVDLDGQSVLARSTGNPDTHIILRGGIDGPNYTPDKVGEAQQLLAASGLSLRLMIDCSHANSGKDHLMQKASAGSVAEQVGGGTRDIIGVMIESNIVGGRQDLGDGTDLTYGQSVTDACLGWEDTVEQLETLARAADKRRSKVY